MLGNYLGLLLGDLVDGSTNSDDYLNMVLDGFSEVFAWLFEMIFVDWLPMFAERGEEAFDMIYMRMYGNLASGEFIGSIIGVMISIPILKLVINIMRG